MMDGIALLLLAGSLSLFKPRFRLQAEILVLRDRSNILRRAAPKRLRLSGNDRLLTV